MKNLNSYRILRPLVDFMKLEASSGIILAICTVIAMILANSAWNGAYMAVLHFKIFGLSVLHWVNDGFMAIFFFVIGMEIKKEVIQGQLSSAQKAILPAAAAFGGMVVPALIYLTLNPESPNANGWGIPMATDIAFALGVLSLFGKRIPLSMKIFLLALAIVDDLGAILVIALFYTEQIHSYALVLAAFLLFCMYGLKTRKVTHYGVYIAVGIGVWIAILVSGVHATVAGVIIGLMTPLQIDLNSDPLQSYSPLDDLIHLLHPWVNFAIMPIFALANAGISLSGLDLDKLIFNPIHQGVVLGLFIGKPLGITLFSYIAVKSGFGQLPVGVRWSQIFAISCLAGIGFTMALFISSLALTADQEIYSKTGILLGSLLSGIIGFICLSFVVRKSSTHARG